ncbi:hypothetical protein Bbelb_280410 [Branchiostoma belcheri]|nr:hypothetical protein Bbelb_280410 [Branchiostoma belcheri]
MKKKLQLRLVARIVLVWTSLQLVTQVPGDQYVGCPDVFLDIDCPYGHVVSIVSAYWGRQPGDFDTCGSSTIDNCYVDVTESYSNLCDGWFGCALPPSERRYGDPCDGNSKYAWVEVNCLLIVCPTLSNPSNGGVSYSSRYYGDVASYSCDTGYSLNGSSSRTCQRTWTWSESEPTCLVVECPALSNPSNGGVSYSSRYYGDVASYSCPYCLAGSWTDWFNRDQPWGDEDNEMLTHLRQDYPGQICATPTAVHARVNSTHQEASLTGQHIHSYDTTAGFVCRNVDQPDGVCLDYEVRFCCPDDGNSEECPLLTAPANGAMTGSNFYQDVVQFTCSSGYSLVGNPVLTCQANATWNGTVPTCTRKECPVLTAPANGAMTGSNFYQDVVEFTCDSGYNLVGNPTLTCQADATWSGNVTTCERKECPLLTAPANGAMTGSNLYQDVVEFTCDSGYNLVGNPTLTCQADVTWSGNVPTCTRKECPVLTAPANGAMTGSNLYQDVVEFTCDSGYNLVGNPTLTCQADVTWSGNVPTCTRKECPVLTAPANGAMTGSNFYQDVVEFTCDSGYNLVGNPTLTCQADATWSGTVPTCTSTECPVLTAPANGAMTGSNFYQDVVEFTCSSGYNLVGNPTLTCQADATWSGTVPTCERNECPVLTAPANGAMTGSNFYQDVVEFTCSSGYNLVGNPTLTCQADATWSGTVPTCTRKECPLLTAPADGAMTGSNFYQDVVEFTCSSGYNLVGNPAINCQADATWSGNVPTCTRTECPVLTAPVNGAMTGSNFYQDVVEFTCSSGYNLVGSPALTCQADATWGGTVPTCTRKECPLLTAPANGAITGFNFYQDVVQFTCSSGYNLVGNTALSCQADATWSGTVPTCEPAECPLLTVPVNGAMTGSNFYQDLVHFTCISGYDLDGSTSLVCRADATWSGTEPQCTRLQCPQLNAPANGAMTGSNFYEDLVKFTCGSGYDLLGNSALVCQADTTWNGTVPTCTLVGLGKPLNPYVYKNKQKKEPRKSGRYGQLIEVVVWARVQCPLLDAPVHGTIFGNNFYQDMVQFTCNAGYDRVGSSSLTCQADGTWNGIAPTCTRVQCPLLTAPLNGGITGGNFYQDVVQFTCDTGYELVGLSSSLTCQTDRTWDGAAPTCTRVECPELVAAVNGGMTGNYFYQDVMRFTCDSGYDLVGSVSLTCQSDRTWDGIAPTCTRVQCPTLSSPINGESTGNNFYMDTVQFTCLMGYDMVGHPSSTCGADKSWSNNAPSCSDIDECSAANGGCDHVCTNTMGTFHCSCVTGFNLNADELSCDDNDECLIANGGCDQTCSNTIGSFLCSCGNGYVLNSNGYFCDDVNECSTANGGCQQICINLIGSFICSCLNGYSLNSDGVACDDVDECGTLNGGCEQTCTNHIPSFQCLCDAGYILNANGFSCDDVNECLNANGGCEQSCTNTIASYDCSCGLGYSLNDNGVSCDDINECATANAGCEQDCSNTMGSFQCSCRTGFVLNNNGFSCDDINECDSANGGCSQLCNNTIGSFQCFCSTGYMLDVDGFACDDINECDAANGDCGQFCNNTEGSFSCYCATGYSLGVDRLTCDGFDPVSHLSCSTITTTSISITWIKPAADVIGYSIIYTPTQGFFQPSPKTSTRSPGDTDATISGLFSGVQYSISVLAFGLWNDSANNSIECITGLQPPTNVSFSSDSHESVTVHWSHPGRTLVLGYRAWLTDKETMSMISLRHLPRTATSATFTSLVPATEYVLAVSCISEFLEGQQTEVTMITETDPPVRLFADGIHHNSLALFWTPPVARLTGYELTYGSTERHRKRRSTTSVTLPGNSDNYLVQDLVPATQYTFSLTAVSRFGRSTTITLTATTGTDPPLDFNVHKVSSTWMHVKWTPPVAAVVSYDLEVVEAASQVETTHFSIPHSLTAFNVTNLVPTAMYIIRIAAVSVYGRSVSIATFGSTVAVHTVSSLVQMLPVGHFTILDTSAGLFKMDVIDINSVDVSPKQQLKDIRDKQLNFQLKLRQAGFSLTEAIERSANALLAILPIAKEYYTTFQDENVIAVLARSTTGNDVILSRNEVNISASIINCSFNGSADATLDFSIPMAFERTEGPRRRRRGLQGEGLNETQFGVSGVDAARMVTMKRNLTMAYHAFDVPASTVVVVIQLSWWDHAAAYRVFLRYDSPPTEELYDDMHIAMEEDVVLAWHRGTRSLRTWIPALDSRRGKLYVGIQAADYELLVSTVSCLSWEFSSEKWGDTNCGVLLDLSNSAIRCNCSFPGLKAVVGASVHFPPNSIDFDNVFGNPESLNDNNIVFYVIIGEWALYLLLMIFLNMDFQRLREKMRHNSTAPNRKGQLAQLSILPPDRMPAPCLYQITVNTGSMFGAGTSARIGFQVFGSRCKTAVKTFNPRREVLHAATREQQRSFSTLFRENADAMFYDQHLWTSPILSPEGSGFSKSERLSCCFAVANSMMVASAMWFTDDGDNYTRNIELYVSLVTTVIVIPVTVLPLLLFRREIPVPVAAPGIRLTNQSEKRLTRWTKYVAWLIVVLVSIVSSFFVIMYGLDWGKEKSKSWLKAFFLSFCLSSVVAETCQIFILALITTLICQLLTPSNKQRAYDIKEEELHVHLLNGKATEKVYPPEASAVRMTIKRKNLQRQKYFSLLKNATIMVLFVGVLYFISQQNKDPYAFQASQALSNRLTDHFDSITTPEDFWMWTNQVMLPVLYPSFWYNGWKMKYLDRQFPLYTEAFTIGKPRLTQMRVAPDTTELDGSQNGWVVANENVSRARWLFNITSMLTVNRACISECSMELPTTLNAATSTLTVLQQNDWIDKYTKRLDLELSFYFPSQAIAFKRDGRRYFGSIWNLMASFSILGSAVVICTFVIRYHFASAALDKIVQATGELGIDRFVDFGSAFWWDDTFKYVLAAVVFVNTLSLLRVVNFNKTLAHFLALPGAMKNDLIGFSVISAVAFMAFSCSGMVVFGTHLKAFSNALHTNFALFEMLLGRFVAQEILDANRYVGPVYFTFFMVLIFILLVNFLVTIICDAIASGDSIEDDYDQDLVDYIWTSFKEMFGIHSPPPPDVTTDEDKLSKLNANLQKIEESLDETLDFTKCLWPKIKTRSEVPCSSSDGQYVKHHSTTLSSDTCQIIHEDVTSLAIPAVPDVQEQVQCLLKVHEDDTARLAELHDESRRRAEAILKRKLAERRGKSQLERDKQKQQTMVETAKDLIEQHAADKSRMEKRQRNARRLFESKLRQKLAARRYPPTSQKRAGTSPPVCVSPQGANVEKTDDLFRVERQLIN